MKKNKRIIFLLTLFILNIFFVCKEGITQEPQARNKRSQFGYGLDYARVKGFAGIKDPASLFAQTGANWVKWPAVMWQAIQPKENGPYQWGLNDQVVRNYQEHGFEMLLEITCNANWAVEEIRRSGGVTGPFIARPPKEGYWDDYAAFVTAVVERYDGDGIDDMPGLLRPITHFEIESEAQHEGYWQVPEGKDAVVEYGQLLKTAYAAAHQANPHVVVILSGINFGDIFGDGKERTYEELLNFIDRQFLATTSQNPGDKKSWKFWRSSLDFIYRTLAMSAYYDAVEFHYNQDYRAAGPTMKFIRGVMAQHGPVKPIWAGDALIANSYVMASPVALSHPFPHLGNALVDAMDHPQDPYHDRVWAWHLTEQASNMVKKVVLALDTGMEGIMSANEVDWPEYKGISSNWRYAGFYGVKRPELPGIPLGKRPVFHTHKLLVETLGLAPKEIKRLNIINDHNLFVYKIVTEKDQELYAAWYEDPAAERALKGVRNLKEFFDVKKAAINIDLSSVIATDTVKVTDIITEHGQSEPVIKTAKTDQMKISSVPVLIEPSSKRFSSKSQDTAGTLESQYFEYIPGPGAVGIFVRNNIAYVTTNKGIYVYQVINKKTPKLISIYTILSPANITIVGDYAYVARGKMNENIGYLTILDVSNLQELRQVGEVQLPHGTISVEVENNYAYLGGYDAGVFVVDVTDKRNPRHVNTITFPRITNPKQDELPIGKILCSRPGKRDKFPCALGRSWWLHIQDYWLYVNDENTGLHILDISSPANPQEISNLMFPLWEGRDDLSRDAYNDIDVKGHIGYVAMDNGGILTVDLSNKEQPLPLSHLNLWKDYTWKESPGHVAQIVAKDNIVCATAGEAGVFLYDVNDPNQPKLIVNDRLRGDLGASWGLFLEDDYLYVTYIAVDPGSPGLKKGGWEIFKIKPSQFPAARSGVHAEAMNKDLTPTHAKEKTISGFQFGFEWAHPDVAEFYADLGVTITKSQGPLASWKRISPVQGQYDFSLLDELVVKPYQDNGFRDIHVWIQVDAGWGTDKSTTCPQTATASYPIKPGFEKDFHDFIYNLVERYDHDGIDDMPGLQCPITYFEILSEAQHNLNFCPPRESDRLREYAKILETAYNAAKEANPDAKIILSGITMEQVFNDFPSRKIVKERMDCMGRGFHEQMAFVEESLKLPYYDIVEVHNLEDPMQLYGFRRWLKDMDVIKPVWVGDAAPLLPLTHPVPVCSDIRYPNGQKLILAIDNARMARYEERSVLPVHKLLEAWYDKIQSIQLVQRVVIAAEAGYAGITMGNNFDWPQWRKAPNRWKEWAWMGLVQVDNAKKAHPLDGQKMNVDYARPAYHAYKEIIAFIDGFDAVKRIELDDVYLFEFIVGGEKKYVAWYDDGTYECPACPVTQEGSKVVDLTNIFSNERVYTRKIVTQLDGQNQPLHPERQMFSVRSVPISETPIFLE